MGNIVSVIWSFEETILGLVILAAIAGVGYLGYKTFIAYEECQKSSPGSSVLDCLAQGGVKAGIGAAKDVIKTSTSLWKDVVGGLIDGISGSETTGTPGSSDYRASVGTLYTDCVSDTAVWNWGNKWSNCINDWKSR